VQFSEKAASSSIAAAYRQCTNDLRSTEVPSDADDTVARLRNELDALGRCGFVECCGPRTNCEGCGQPCTRLDYAAFDGHGSDCPQGDDHCELRVCDPTHSDPSAHDGCETQADRDGAGALVRAEAVSAHWAADDPLESLGNEVVAWRRREFPGVGGGTIHDAAKVAEEAGEVCGAAIKWAEGRRARQDVLDEAADTIIATVALLAGLGVDPGRAVADRWSVVGARCFASAEGL